MKTAEQYEQEIADRDRLIALMREQLRKALDEVAAMTRQEIELRKAS
jgi:hypothetical protein